MPEALEPEPDRRAALGRLDAGLLGANNRLKQYGTLGALVLGILTVVGLVVQLSGRDEPPPTGSATPTVVTGAPSSADACSGSGESAAPSAAPPPWLCAAIRGSLSDPGLRTDRPVLKVNETAQLKIRFENVSDAPVHDVVLRISLPDAGLDYVEGTTILYTSKAPEGARVSDGLAERGVNVGSYAPGGVTYVFATIQVGGAESYECGTTTTAIGVHLAIGDDHRRDDVPVEIERPC